MNNGTQTANGHVSDASRSRLEDLLVGEPLTEGYKPTLPLWALEGAWLPQLFLLRDVELMQTHPVVASNLAYFKSGIASVEFEVEADPTTTEFIQSQCRQFWDRGVPLLQGGYDYGWIGTENCYAHDDAGQLRWDHLVQFNPRDTFLLTREHVPVGVRVRQVQDKGDVDLWLASEDIPAKALWYPHEPRYNSFYGRSQMLPAWRPWRRLAWKDAVETVADTGVYRFAYAGPVIRYPEEDLQVAGPAVACTLDSQGRPRRFARDAARQMSEWLKAGAGVGLPSTKYPPEMGGGDKWGMELPKSVLNIDGLISYIKHLWDQISYGIGVPPELMVAGESGSGYSGRKIPREAFLMRNQRIADAILLLFVNQVLKPLVKWNFGHTRFRVRVKDILAQERAAQVGKTTDQKEQGAARAEGMANGPAATGALAGTTKQPAPAAPQQDMTAQFSVTSVTDRVRQIAQRILRRAA